MREPGHGFLRLVPRPDKAEVGTLAGASTCPDGFNDAIEQIREQASGSAED